MLRSISYGVMYLSFVCIAFLIAPCFTAPVNSIDTPYALFLEDLNQNKCSIPNQIRPPDGNKLEPFSSALEVCKSADYVTLSKEASIICPEILVLLRKIWCTNESTGLPEINVPFTHEMCKGFASFKAMLPNNNLQRLADADAFFCGLMCQGAFENACQVLLWSYKVQNQLDAVGNAENLKQKESVPENEIDTNVSKIKNTMHVILTQTEKDGTSTMGKTDPEAQKGKNKLKPLHSTVVEDSKMMIPEKQTDEVAVAANENIKLQPSVTGSQSSKQITPATNEILNQQSTTHGKIIVPNTSNSDKVKNELTESAIDNNVHPNPQQNEIENKVRNDDKKIMVDSKKTDNQLTVGMPTDAQPSHSAIDKVPQQEGTNEFPGEHQIPPISVLDTASKSSPEKPVPAAESNDANADNGMKPVDENKLVDENKQMVENKIDKIQQIDENKHDENKAVDENEQIDENRPVDEEESVEPPVATSAKTASKPVADEHSEDQFSISEAANIEPSEIPKPTQVAVLEKMDEGESPVDKEDPDQYNGDIYEPAKNKESNSGGANTATSNKDSVVAQSEMSNSYNEFPSRNSFGRGAQDIQVIASFPEQEDSHFFFYFLSIVLILMAGYLLFHNKQKIIALIVEGRHERRRRSHGVGYKKLETK